jgi:hypothetical protein
MEQNNYDAVSERLPENCTLEERFQKFSNILVMLNAAGIHLVEAIPNPVVEDPSCGFKMTHNRITWEIYRREDVFDMIVKARDDYKKRKNEHETE